MPSKINHDKLYVFTFGVPNEPPEQRTVRAASEEHARAVAERIAQAEGWFANPELWSVLPLQEAVVFIGDTSGICTVVRRPLTTHSALGTLSF